MRLIARIGSLLVIVILVTVVIFWPGTAAPRHTTIREILADPVSFDGTLVVFTVTAFETGPDGKTLIYRRVAGRLPLVVVELAPPYPDRRPVSVVGKVKTGTPLRITDARPAP